MKKTANLFQKAIALLFVCASLVLLVGRNHFILGSLLYGGKIFLGILMLWLLYSLSKRASAQAFKKALLASLLLLLAESLWNQANEYRSDAPSLEKTISFMSYNIYFKNNHPKAVIAKIKQQQADILVIQELTPAWNRHLEAALASKYPYRKKVVLKGTHGIGIYSKYKILHSESLLNSSRLPYAQVSTIAVEGKKIQVFNAHTASPAKAVENPDRFLEYYRKIYFLRQQQLATITQKAIGEASKYHAQILIGDLNTPSQEPLFRDLQYDWENISDIGWTPNFPNSSKVPPLLRLDYLMARGKATGQSFEVIAGGSSDHLAIFGKIKL